MQRGGIGVISALAWTCLAFPRAAQAHAGPPFPIIVDKPVPGYIATLWADPDIGQAMLYVVLDPDESQSATTVTGVTFWVQPVSERLPKVEYEGDRSSRRGHLRFTAKPEFDRGEMWKVGFDVQLANGSSRAFETQVEATPPGIGPWGLLFFLVPFLLFGGLWGMVFIRRSRAMARLRQEQAQAAADAAGPDLSTSA